MPATCPLRPLRFGLMLAACAAPAATPATTFTDLQIEQFFDYSVIVFTTIGDGRTANTTLADFQDTNGATSSPVVELTESIFSPGRPATPGNPATPDNTTAKAVLHLFECRMDVIA